MASHADLILIINQLLQGLGKIGDSLSVEKAIGEEVNAMKEDIKFIKRGLEKIEEKIGDELPAKYDVSAIREMLDVKLKLFDQIRTMDERILKIEGSIFHLRSIDSQINAEISDRVKNTERNLVSMEETLNKLMLTMENSTRFRDELHTQSDVSAIRETLNVMLKPLDQIRTMYERVQKMEGSISHLSLRSMQSPMESDMIFLNKTLGENLNITKKLSVRMEKIESRLDSIENTLQSFNETRKNVFKNMPVNGHYLHFEDKIVGKKIMLHNNLRTAIRKTPHEGSGHAGVLSNIPLTDDVAFEIRIEETIDGRRDRSIGLGVIVKKDEAVRENWSICDNVPGTYGIRSYYYADKGKSHILKDGKVIRHNAYNLDTRDLPVGTTLGVVRRSNGDLHFLLNGCDLGVAFYNIPDDVYAFFDVMYYVSKVTIIN